jgi:hypothetical protein
MRHLLVRHLVKSRLSLALVLMLFQVCLIDVSHAARAGKSKRAAGKAERPLAAQPKRSPRDSVSETALRTIGVAAISVQKSLASEISEQQASDLAKQIAKELTAKSYLKANFVEGASATPGGREAMTAAMKANNLDGTVLGVATPTGVNLTLWSRNGERLATSSVSSRLRLVNAAKLNELATSIVDEIVRMVPYRGFLVREVEDGVFELNLGSDHGLMKGQKLRVFDFSDFSLTSEKIDRGEIEVLEVQKETSIVETTSDNHQLKPFQKVGFDERARGMVVQTQTPTRGYAMIGGELISVTGTSDPNFADKSYNMKSTPGLVLGLGWNKTVFRAVLAQARNEDVDLVFTEVLGLYRLWEKQNGFNRFTFSVGGRLARFGVTTRKSVTTPLESSTSLSPVFDVGLERMISGPVHAFVGGNVYYPMLNSGNGSSSSVIFAYGAGGEIGAGIDFSPRITLEIGTKIHYIRRPVEGQSAVQERYSEIFADLIARF